MRFTLPLALLLTVPAVAGAAGNPGRPGMVRLPEGSIGRMYTMVGDTTTRQRVQGFWIDRDPVTRGGFLVFVRANPQWRRSTVAGVYAQAATYLRDWRDDLDSGNARARNLPVTWVSWHAAQAFCRDRGLRLPTLAEWEYAAAADETRHDASRDPRFMQHLISLYAQRGRTAVAPRALVPNAWGIRGLHEYGWEWVDDYNSTLVSDDSRGVGGRDVDAVCASAAIGATNPTNYPAFLRAAVRAGLDGNGGMASLGFRCATS